MSPANIEATLKTASPLIGQACCIGDRRPYNTALIVLDADFAPAWAAQAGIEDASLEALARDERVRAAVAGGRRRRQREARARRTDQELHDRRGRLAAGRRRADADDEAQAQADRREVRARRSRRCTAAERAPKAWSERAPNGRGTGSPRHSCECRDDPSIRRSVPRYQGSAPGAQCNAGSAVADTAAWH